VRQVAETAEKKRIAVGCGSRRERCADHPACTATIVNDHLLPDDLSQPLADCTGEDVVAAARRKRHE
jgi:hypothetical protein